MRHVDPLPRNSGEKTGDSIIAVVKVQPCVHFVCWQRENTQKMEEVFSGRSVPELYKEDQNFSCWLCWELLLCEVASWCLRPGLVRKPRGRGTFAVGSRYQAKANGVRGDFLCPVITVFLGVCNSVTLSLLFVVTCCFESSINPITNPNPSHRHRSCDNTHIIVYLFQYCKCIWNLNYTALYPLPRLISCD
jgi:hypothetical protein